MAFMMMHQLLQISLLRLPSGGSRDAVRRHFELLCGPANTTCDIEHKLGAFFRGSTNTSTCVDRNCWGSGEDSGEADGDRDCNHAREGLTAMVTMKVVTETMHEMHCQYCFAAALLLLGWFCAGYLHGA